MAMLRRRPPVVTVKPTKWRPGSGVASVGRPRSSRTSQVADQRLQGWAEAGARYDGVRAQARAVRQDDLFAFEALDGRDHSHAAGADCVDDAHVEDRDHPLPDERRRGRLFRDREPIRRQVGDGVPPEEHRDRVDPRRGQLRHEDADRLARDAEAVAADDVRRRPHRELHARGAAVGEVDGDLRSRVPCADDEDVLALERLRVPVLGRVDQRAGKVRAAGPVGQHGPPVVARCDDHARRLERPLGRLDAPAAVGPLDPPGLDAVANLEAVAVGVLAQVVADCRRAAPTSRSCAGCRGRAAPRATEPCAGGAGRSAGASSSRPRGRARARPARARGA